MSDYIPQKIREYHHISYLNLRICVSKIANRSTTYHRLTASHNNTINCFVCVCTISLCLLVISRPNICERSAYFWRAKSVLLAYTLGPNYLGVKVPVWLGLKTVWSMELKRLESNCAETVISRRSGDNKVRVSFNFNPRRISNHTHSKIWCEITCPNLIVDVIIYPCWD